MLCCVERGVVCVACVLYLLGVVCVICVACGLRVSVCVVCVVWVVCVVGMMIVVSVVFVSGVIGDENISRIGLCIFEWWIENYIVRVYSYILYFSLVPLVNFNKRMRILRGGSSGYMIYPLLEFSTVVFSGIYNLL